MKESKALKLLLVSWALAYYADGSEKCIFDMFLDKPVSDNLVALEWVAKITWFGTYNPDDSDIEVFAEQYRNCMLAIYYNLHEIMVGDILIEEVIIASLIKVS